MKTNLLKNITLAIVALVGISACQSGTDLNFGQSEFQKRAEVHMANIANNLSAAKSGKGGNAFYGVQPTWPTMPAYNQNQVQNVLPACKSQAQNATVNTVDDFKRMLAMEYQCITFVQNQFNPTQAFIYQQGTPLTQYSYNYMGLYPTNYSVVDVFAMLRNQASQVPVQNYMNYMGYAGATYYR